MAFLIQFLNNEKGILLFYGTVSVLSGFGEFFRGRKCIDKSNKINS